MGPADRCARAAPCGCTDMANWHRPEHHGEWRPKPGRAWRVWRMIVTLAAFALMLAGPIATILILYLFRGVTPTP